MASNVPRNQLTHEEFFVLATELRNNADEYERLTLPVATARAHKVVQFEISQANVQKAASMVGIKFKPSQKFHTREKARELEKRVSKLEVWANKVDPIVHHDEERITHVSRRIDAFCQAADTRIESLEKAVTQRLDSISSALNEAVRRVAALETCFGRLKHQVEEIEDAVTTPSPKSEEIVVPPIRSCRYCNRPIRWLVVAESGSRMPVDPEPGEKGNVEILPGSKCAVHNRPADREEARRLGKPLYLAHFVTCPNYPGRNGKVAAAQQSSADNGLFTDKSAEEPAA